MNVTNCKARNKFVSSILLLDSEITSKHVILYWSAYSHSSVYTQQLFSMHFPSLLVSLFFSQLCLTHNSYLPPSSLEIAHSMTMIFSFFLVFSSSLPLFRNTPQVLHFFKYLPLHCIEQVIASLTFTRAD